MNGEDMHRYVPLSRRAEKKSLINLGIREVAPATPQECISIRTRQGWFYMATQLVLGRRERFYEFLIERFEDGERVRVLGPEPWRRAHRYATVCGVVDSGGMSLGSIAEGRASWRSSEVGERAYLLEFSPGGGGHWWTGLQQKEIVDQADAYRAKVGLSQFSVEKLYRWEEFAKLA